MLPLLGACVPPTVGDAYCGPAAILEAGGCAFRTCTSGERLDVVTGACTLGLSVARADTEPCGEGGIALLQDGHVACVPPDATCPRGARRAAQAPACERSPACPPGSLSDASGCRPIVTSGGRFGDRRVDVGLWAALVLGFDGGSGSRDLCQPLQQNSATLALPHGPEIEVAVSLAVPDQDIARVRADVTVETSEADAASRPPPGSNLTPGSNPVASPGAGGWHPAGADLQRRVSADVGTLVEALRGLGGEATAAAVDVHVRCALQRQQGQPQVAPGDGGGGDASSLPSP
jgi:hypothetical protein